MISCISCSKIFSVYCQHHETLSMIVVHLKKSFDRAELMFCIEMNLT